MKRRKIIPMVKKKKIFGINDLSTPTEDALNIFKTLSTLYVGGASIVELKTPKEGYFEEMKRMELLKQGNVQGSAEMKKLIKLGPDQNNIFMSEIGLNESYAVIAPWGGGKSILLELKLSRVVKIYDGTKEPVKIFLVVYEMKATNLLKQYQTFVKYLERIEPIQIHVMNLKEICKQNLVQHENRFVNKTQTFQ